jgi:hypothetical protein
MDLNKRFEQFMEDYGGTPNVGPPSPGYTAIDDVDANVQDLGNAEWIDKLNYYLSQLSNQPYINPYGVLQQLRMKLNMIGLDFERPLFVGDSGEVDSKLSMGAGRNGYLDLHKGTIGHDDGISNRVPGGLKIHFSFAKANGRYSINAKIVAGKVDNGDDHESPAFPVNPVGPTKVG